MSEVNHFTGTTHSVPQISNFGEDGKK